MTKEGVFLLIAFFLGFIIGSLVGPDNFRGLTQKESSLEPEIDIGAATAYLRFKQIKDEFLPSGVPEVYGEELGVSFSQIQESIDRVAPLDPAFGRKRIALAGSDLERYIQVGLQIACEYCCGVKTLVKKDGEAACGCAHSQMMRGLTAYLIKNHPDLSNRDILEELTLWKRAYFPKQTLSVQLNQMIQSGEPGIKRILDEFPDFLPEMVGGC